MVKMFRTAFLLLCLAAVLSFALSRATLEQERLAHDEYRYVLPTALLKLTSLEFDGLVSDFLFLDALVFQGRMTERSERSGPRISQEEWKWLWGQLMACVELDPYFLDPYLLGNANLTWGGGLVVEANQLLERGVEFRHWDWTLPFFVGFNNFYFLKDNAEASRYLMESSLRPGASPMVATLAARMAYEGQRTETAISYLQGILVQTQDLETREQYGKRLKALQGIHLIEQAVDGYRERFNRDPETIEALLVARMLFSLPEDPYGGRFYLDAEGQVKTTSNFLD